MSITKNVILIGILQWTFENQILALFESSSITQFSKFNNFLCVCWFSGKNLSNLVPPVWKLDNPYCRSNYNNWARNNFQNVLTKEEEPLAHAPVALAFVVYSQILNVGIQSLKIKHISGKKLKKKSDDSAHHLSWQYRVFKLDLHQNKCLLGHQKCTFKS